MNSPVWNDIAYQGYHRGHVNLQQWPAETLLAEPEAVVEQILGVRPEAVKARFITPEPGGRTYVNSDADGMFHTDHVVDGFPAPIQFLFCIDPSEKGGDTLLIDGWKLLDEASQTDPELYDALFSVRREMVIQPRACVAPTFNLEGRTLYLIHPTRPSDAVGAAVQTWVDAQVPTRFRMERGDYTVTHNHRMFHSRSPFKGYRKLVRLMAWLPCPLAAPSHHLAFAAAVHDRAGMTSASVPVA